MTLLINSSEISSLKTLIWKSCPCTLQYKTLVPPPKPADVNAFLLQRLTYKKRYSRANKETAMTGFVIYYFFTRGCWILSSCLLWKIWKLSDPVNITVPWSAARIDKSHRWFKASVRRVQRWLLLMFLYPRSSELICGPRQTMFKSRACFSHHQLLYQLKSWKKKAA